MKGLWSLREPILAIQQNKKRRAKGLRTTYLLVPLIHFETYMTQHVTFRTFAAAVNTLAPSLAIRTDRRPVRPSLITLLEPFEANNNTGS